MAEKRIGNKVVRVIVDDITDIDVEAFVYDITDDAKLGSGYGGAITQRGGPSVQAELDAIGNVPTGTAVTTAAGKLKAQHIIHVNGPKFHEPDTEGKLRRATEAALEQAEQNGIAKLAFPPIGTGLYQVPLDLCAEVMMDTVEEHLKGGVRLEEVLFVALNTREFEPLQSRLEGGA
jgi:O-acetyl-ADP-ribose deacetylase (regulator of RNase III)